MLPDMTYRARLTELMDDPECSEELLLQTIRQFASINLLVSSYRTILKRWVLADMLQEPDRTYHMVDMGAGGCDIDAWLLRTACRRGLNLRITACDLDPRIIRYAEATYGGINGLTIRRFDLLTDSLEEPVDFVFANHFLHHLTEEQILHLLQRWQPRVSRRMVLSDLERSRAAYLAFSLFARIYRNSFARPDGLTSIRRGFKAEELRKLARQALPESRCAVRRVFPGRLVLSIDGNAGMTA